MCHPSLTSRLFLSFLTVFFALYPLTSAQDPGPLNIITTPTLLNSNSSLSTGTTPTLPSLNNSLSTGPAPQVVIIDGSHSVYFTEYRHLTPERNYFAAIIATQTGIIEEYFARRVETLALGHVSLTGYGVTVLVDNPTGTLTYAAAHRVLGELGKFLMKGNFCTAKFELWQVQGYSGKQLSVGWIVPQTLANSVA